MRQAAGDALGLLTALRSLRLDDNGLRELPDAIARLTALRTLSLRDNALCLLPTALGRLTALEELDVCGNPLQSQPPDVVRRGAQAVVAWPLGRNGVSGGEDRGRGRCGDRNRFAPFNPFNTFHLYLCNKYLHL